MGLWIELKLLGSTVSLVFCFLNIFLLLQIKISNPLTSLLVVFLMVFNLLTMTFFLNPYEKNNTS